MGGLIYKNAKYEDHYFMKPLRGIQLVTETILLKEPNARVKVIAKAVPAFEGGASSPSFETELILSTDTFLGSLLSQCVCLCRAHFTELEVSASKTQWMFQSSNMSENPRRQLHDA